MNNIIKLGLKIGHINWIQILNSKRANIQWVDHKFFKDFIVRAIENG